MGASSYRRLRAAFSFIIRPLLGAVVFTIFIRMLFAPSSPKPLKPLPVVKPAVEPIKFERKPESPAPRPPTGPSKALVIASTSKQPEKETSWISQVPSDWKVFNYVTDAPASPDLAVPINKGNEAMAYLTHIIDRYDDLADVTFFHHSHNKAWHQEIDSLSEVRRLRAAYVQEVGFASARCLPGCENIVPLADYTVSFDRFPTAGRDAHLTSLLFAFLDKDKGELVPLKLAAPCCAQFAASKEAIRGRSREWWTRLRQWLIDTPLDSMTSGRLLEHTWHMWLGQEAEHCPKYNVCKCHVFGMGNCDGLLESKKEL